MNKNNIITIILVVLVIVFGYMALAGGNFSQQASSIKSGVSSGVSAKAELEQFAKKNGATVYQFTPEDFSRVQDVLSSINASGTSEDRYKYFCIGNYWDPNHFFYYTTNGWQGNVWYTPGGVVTCYFIESVL